jgi:hypothetical protein
MEPLARLTDGAADTVAAGLHALNFGEGFPVLLEDLLEGLDALLHLAGALLGAALLDDTVEDAAADPGQADALAVSVQLEGLGGVVNARLDPAELLVELADVGLHSLEILVGELAPQRALRVEKPVLERVEV